MRERVFSTLDRAITTKPDNPESYAVLAWALTQDNRFDEAEIQANKAVEIDSNHGFSVVMLGEVDL